MIAERPDAVPPMSASAGPRHVRLVVLASGSGTNLQALLDVRASRHLDVAAVVSDQPTAQALERARSARVPAVALPAAPAESRRSYDRRLAEVVDQYHADVVVLAGWMRLLSSTMLDRFPGRVINLHPALPGEFPGVRAIDRALDDARETGRRQTGVMVHLVPDEGVDNGPVLASERVPIEPDDDVASLTARLRPVEHRLLVDVVSRWDVHREHLTSSNVRHQQPTGPDEPERRQA